MVNSNQSFGDTQALPLHSHPHPSLIRDWVTLTSLVSPADGGVSTDLVAFLGSEICFFFFINADNNINFRVTSLGSLETN